MAVFVPLLDGARVEIGFSLGGKTVENLLWFIDRQPPITLTQLQALADGVAAWHVAEVLPLLSSDIELLSVLAVKWDDHAGDTFAQSDVHLFGGTAVQSHSANVAVKIRFKGSTAQTWRDGSNFVPGIPVDAVNLNRVEHTFAEALRFAYVDLIDLAAVFGPFPAWRWVITSQFLDGSARTTQAFARTDFPRVRELPVAQRRKRLAP